MKASPTVAQYIAAQPPGTRRELKKLRAAIKAALPGATEAISYGIPAFKRDGRACIYYAGWKQHTSLYPITAAIQRAFADELEGYETSKGTVRFPLAKPLPVTLIKKLVKARVAEPPAKGARRTS